MNIEIRKLTRKDMSEENVSLIRNADSNYDLEEILSLIGANEFDLYESAWGCFLGGKLIGCCSMKYAYFYDENDEVDEETNQWLWSTGTGWSCASLYLNNVYIVPKYRNKGYASTMISFVMSNYWKVNPGTIYLQCDEELLPFYKRIGFKVVSNNDYYFGEHDWMYSQKPSKTN